MRPRLAGLALGLAVWMAGAVVLHARSPVSPGGPIPGAAAMLVHLDRTAIERALAAARADEATRARFHEAYTIPLDGPVLRGLEVLTEYRRVVLAAEAAAARGELGWGQAEAARALVPHRGVLSLSLDVRFSPQNAYQTVPPLSVVLYGRDGEGMPIEPLRISRTALDAGGRAVTPGSPILGARIDVDFDATALVPSATYLIGVLDGRAELQRVAVDLGRLQ